MYVIVIYDVDARRCKKLHKYLSQHLTWVQNSVFEGELSKADYKIVGNELKKLIKTSEDSVILYNLGNSKWLNRDVIGEERNEVTNMI